MNEKKVEFEIESLNVEDLSVEDLERRIELAVGVPVLDGIWCDCNNQIIIIEA